MKCRRALRRLADQPDRRPRPPAAGALPGLFGVVLEEIARLQRLDRRLVGGRGEMKIAGIVAVLHDAVANPALQLGVAVERGNEAADFLVPGVRGAVGELIFDHEVLHGGLLAWSDLGRRRFANRRAHGDPFAERARITAAPYSAPVRKGLVIRSWRMLEPGPWPQMKPTSSASGINFSLIDLIKVA